MQIDFYYWGGMCPISDEIIQILSRYNDQFDIRLHDITNDFDLAKNKSMFFPFLTIVNHKERYYGPVSEVFLQTLSTGMMPKETPYRITMGTVEKSADIQPIHKDNYFLASHCTGRSNCSGCSSKVKMYQDFPDGMIGFMNIDNETLLGARSTFHLCAFHMIFPRDRKLHLLPVFTCQMRRLIINQHH